MSMHPTTNYFKEYKADCLIFIETGTYRGEGMNLAIEAGFYELHSVDIVRRDDICYKYPGVGTVKCYIDNSVSVLQWLLPTITQRCLFWLDAHSQMQEGEPDNYPLLNELGVIAQHSRNDHTILIDDLLYMSHPDITGWSKPIIEDAIYAINPDYKIKYLPNPIRNNILLAYV